MAIARFLTKQLEKMDKSAKKMAGSPGYDEDTLAAQKEYAREQKMEKSKKLSKEEEAAADREAYNAAMGISKKDAKKGPLTEKEKKQLQEEINMAKGGAVKKMARGGILSGIKNRVQQAPKEAPKVKKQMPEPPPKATPTGPKVPLSSLQSRVPAMAKGGTVKKYAKGGMAMANCGASMKPAQKAKK